MKLPQIVALYVGAVLGSGILVIPGVAAEISGPASLLAWGFMAIMVLPMSLTMGLLSAMHPHSGGVSHFVAKAFHPWIGALVGWYFVMAVVVGAPVLALTGSGYLCAAFGLNDAYRLLIAVALLLAALLSNHFGMRLTGRVQTLIVLITLTVLTFAIFGSLQRIEPTHFTPFTPNGWASVGVTSTVLFWCFIGWEAVSNFSGEFENPRRDAVKGAVIAALLISAFYFLTALVVVGTHSYGPGVSDTALVQIIKTDWGVKGGAIVGFAALLICLAPAIAYTGSIARMIQSLSESGYAPAKLSTSSAKRGTPTGGLVFLAVCYAFLLVLFNTRVVSLATLIQLPSAAFILTYLGACAAGIRLLGNSGLGRVASITSFALSLGMLFCVRWTIWYPVLITLALFLYLRLKSVPSSRASLKGN